MGSTTTHGLPYPVGTDRVMDGDNAMQALAEAVDAHLYGGGSAPAGAPGLWQDATGTVVCTDASLAAQAGSSVGVARYMKIGRTVTFAGNATSGSAASNCAISLPNSLAGVPRDRMFACGVAVAMGASIPAQSGVGYMSAQKDRLIIAAFTNGYVSVPATSAIRWTVTYEVLT